MTSSTIYANPPASKIDVHQHLWPAELVDALQRRSRPPRLRGWTLQLAGEGDHDTLQRTHDAADRAALALADGLDLVLISLSTALGIELLPAAESNRLLDAYHDGAAALPAPFGAWAAACLTEIDPVALAHELERGFVGLALPANALLDRAGYQRMAPLLDVLERAGRPLFIHPGPTSAGGPGAPYWWPAIVSYVQQMHAAWFAFGLHGRPRHPDLRVCFAMMAGLAPLHGERFAVRAGQARAVDERAFLDVSSYGTRAVDATIRVVGVDPLVNGSDRPYAPPLPLDLGAALQHALSTTNPNRLLHPQEEVSNAMDITAVAQSAAR
jgi:hypothetical protein